MKLVVLFVSGLLLSSMAMAGGANEAGSTPVQPPVVVHQPSDYVTLDNNDYNSVLQALEDSIGNTVFRCVAIDPDSQTTVFNTPGIDIVTKDLASISRRTDGQPALKLFYDDPNERENEEVGIDTYDVVALITTNLNESAIIKYQRLVKIIAAPRSVNEGTITHPNYVKMPSAVSYSHVTWITTDAPLIGHEVLTKLIDFYETVMKNESYLKTIADFFLLAVRNEDAKNVIKCLQHRSVFLALNVRE